MTEPITRGVLWEKVFLEVSQNSQENTCARVSFLIKLLDSAWNFIKKETLAQVSSCEFCEVSKNNFFTQHLRTTASVMMLLMTSSNDQFRSSHQKCSIKKGVLKNFTKFTRKHLWQSFFFHKVVGWGLLIEKETLAQVFSCEFCEISKNTFFTEHFWTTASVNYY